MPHHLQRDPVPIGTGVVIVLGVRGTSCPVILRGRSRPPREWEEWEEYIRSLKLRARD